MHLSLDEQTDLQKYIKSCVVDKKNLDSFRKAYDSCSARRVGELEWWQKPESVISLVVVSVMIGMGIGN